jgi:ankyrin repeat protein
VLTSGAHVRNDSGNTALHLAAVSGRTAACEALIAACADVNDTDTNGNTALIFTTDIETVAVLINAGASIDAADSNDLSALRHAARSVYALRLWIWPALGQM